MKKLQEVIENSKGKILSVTFIKKDGTERTLHGRLGVTKHLKGGTSSVDHGRYILLYDLDNAGYRCVNRETITRVKLGEIHE